MYLFSRVFLFLFSICNCAKHINPSIINMNVLVTGAAGFIGSNLCMRLLEELSDTLADTNVPICYFMFNLPIMGSSGQS